MSFIKRKIKAVFDMKAGGGNFSIEIEDHRIVANIETAGLVGLGQLNLQIFGLSQSVMNRLTVISKIPGMLNNTIAVYAGDKDSLSQVYFGTIVMSYADYSNAPDVYLCVTGQVGAFQSIVNDPDSHFPGECNAIEMLKTLTGKMGYNFENESNMQPIILRDSTYTGSYYKQVKDVLNDARIGNNNFENGTLAIWPNNSYRKSPIVTLSDKTGMVGYPTYTMFGFSATTVYNPKLIFGGLVKLETSYKPVFITTGGLWQIYQMIHTLTSEIPGGPWFTRIEAQGDMSDRAITP